MKLKHCYELKSASLCSSVTGKEMRRLKEKVPRSEEDLWMCVRNKMQPLIRSSMQLRKDMGLSLAGRRIKVMVGNR